jgi:WD40 repeat protein
MLRSRKAVGFLNSLAFNSSGTAVAAGVHEGTAATWDTRALRPTPLPAPGGDVTGATFSRDGNLLLVTSVASASLWDRTLRRVILELPQSPDIRAAFSPDASLIVLAGRSRLQVLRCDACAPLRELIRRAKSLLPA